MLCAYRLPPEMRHFTPPSTRPLGPKASAHLDSLSARVPSSAAPARLLEARRSSCWICRWVSSCPCTSLIITSFTSYLDCEQHPLETAPRSLHRFDPAT